ncbi:MAG: class I SAM-dependent methyltransferase [Pseudomonadota bacterium]
MVTKEDVVAAYRFLFGREPENEAVITHYATEVGNRKALRELFINSTEFRASLERIQTPRPPKPPFLGPPMVVEVTAHEDKLEALFAKVGAQWQHLGETEPHWSVLTNDSYFRENFATGRDAFYASGVTELKILDAALARAGLKLENFKTCVELGCGVGRVTIPLARRFASVTGVDISAAHLRVAQDYLDQSGIDNLSLVRLNSIADVDKLGSFDVLYSRIVLQHNPPPVMARILSDLLKKLNPGGVAFIQLPTYKAGYRFQINAYLATQNTTEMEMHFLPQSFLLGLIQEHDCSVLEIREDDSIGLSVTAISNTLLIQKRSL